ncbi:MAG: HAMP domain-containing protein [Desulfobacteraceae bacterium]|jgi:HAMP domain-containing protein
MIIECQSCGKKYRFNENQLKSNSTLKIPCKACGHPLEISNSAQQTSNFSSPKRFSAKKAEPSASGDASSNYDEFLDKRQEVYWRDSIQFKFNLNLIIVMLLILILYTLINAVTTKRRMTEDLNELAQRTSSRLSKSLIAPLWELDEIQIQEYLVSEMMEQNIFGIIIKDIDKKTILYGSKRRDDWLIEKTKAPITEDLIFSSSDVFKEDELIGVVEIYVARKFINMETFREIRNITITTILLILSIFATTFFTLRKLLIEPISHLTEAAERISLGDFNVKIEHDAQDEIGILAKALERMRVSLHYAIYRLKSRA